MNFDKLIRTRKSTKKFKSTKPDWRDIIEAVDAARFAPMAGGIYTLKFIVIEDEEKIKKITAACQQDFVAQAKYLVVVCSNPSLTKNAYGSKGEVYCRQQAGSGIQNFWLKLVEKKLSTCWVGYFVGSMIKETLKIPENINIEAVFPIGYEYEKPIEKKAKINIDSILYFETYGNKKMKPEKKLSA